MRARPSIMSAKEIDAQLRKTNLVEALRPGEFGWAVEVRYTLGLAAIDLAKRMGISQPAVTKLERNEVAGVISLERLTAMADALDCDFVYGFVPRTPLEETARQNEEKLEAARKAKRKLPRLA
jgi:predicted DNA-binding mobile mystery protein A